MEQSDKQLLKLAQKRVEFRQHAVVYVVFNIIFWVIWALGRDTYSTYELLPWPVYPAFWWGFGLAAHYYSVFHRAGNAVQREYERLLQKREDGTL